VAQRSGCEAKPNPKAEKQTYAEFVSVFVHPSYSPFTFFNDKSSLITTNLFKKPGHR